MMDASPYVELSRVWPLVLFFLVAVQLVLPRMILMTGVGQDPDSAWHFLRQTTRAGAGGATYFVYLLLAGTMCTVCTVLGVLAWPTAQAIPAQERLYAAIPESQFLGAMMLAYQLYNVGCACTIADLRTPAFVGHHAMTALLSWFTLAPFVHYYSLFFIGIAESTNFPLTFVDATKAFKSLRNSFPRTNQVSRIAFALSFFAVRMVWWPIVSLDFWRLSLSALRQGTAHSTFIVGTFLVGNIFLTGLQFFWGFQLVKFVKRSFSSGAGDVKTEKKEKTT